MKTSNYIKQAKSLSSLIPFAVGHADYIPTAIKALSALKNERGKENTLPLFQTENPFLLESEKQDLIERADWLLEKVCVEPQKLIDEMPKPIGRMYQGEWAIYACSMTAVALCNIIRIYPDLKERYLPKVPDLIEILMSDELKLYDASQWKEDPLTNLNGDKSHMTYLSLLAWPISCYRLAGGDNRFDYIYQNVCYTLARRMENTRDLNLPSFPNGVIFLPDMMVTLIALKNHGKIFDHRYENLIERWVNNAKNLWIDRRTGLLLSFYYPNGRPGIMQGSYAALNCTYLSMFTPDFARQQYERLKQVFLIGGNYPSIKEYLRKTKPLEFHIDAGPIIEGRSPSGTSFAMGAATFFNDWNLRAGLLKTAELAGHTVRKRGKRHYKLAEIMLTGEAITLAMRTSLNFDKIESNRY